MTSTALKGCFALVRQAMKEQGFSARGETFYRKIEGNTCLLFLQKGVGSSADETRVAVNYGVYNARVGERLQTPPTAALDIWKAHWRKRVAEGGQEVWFRVGTGAKPEECAQSILAGIDAVLPELLRVATDGGLRDAWFSGESPGLGAMQRLLSLSILVNEIGPADRLQPVVAELRVQVAGSIHENLVERQLARAGVNVPPPRTASIS